MAALNRVDIIGNLGQDPELKTTNNGAEYCKISVAVTTKYKKDGETISSTEWLNITLWKQQARFTSGYVKKGDSVFITGHLKVDKWQDETGGNKSALAIVGDRVQILKTAGRTANKTGDTGNVDSNNVDDDLPF